MAKITTADLTALVTLSTGSKEDAICLLKDPMTSDAVRLACWNFDDIDVLTAAARHSKSERTRLKFLDHPSSFVRLSAVAGSSSEKTRRAALMDTSASVRATAVMDAQHDSTRLAVRDDPSSMVRMAAAHDAKLDRTRLAFCHDADRAVQRAAVRGMKKVSTLEKSLRCYLEEESRADVGSRIRSLKSAESLPGAGIGT